MPGILQNRRKSFDVMLVEENPTESFAIQEVLNHIRYPVHVGVVHSGEEILDYLHQAEGDTDSSLPDLLVVDLSLPKMNGWKVLEAVKQDPRLSRIPVLLVSATWKLEDEIRAHELKAEYYLVKPLDLIHFPMLIQAVERALAA